MIQTATRSIDSKSYACTQFPGRLGLVMQARVLKIMGPLLVGFLNSPRKVNSLTDLLDSDIDTSALMLGVSSLDPEAFAQLAIDLLQCTKVDGRDITVEYFNLEFAGDYGHLMRVLLFVVDHNFRSLFPQGGTGSRTVGEQKAAAPSPASSTQS